MRSSSIALLLCVCIALAGPASAEFTFSFVGVDQVAVGADYEQLHLHGVITNTGDERDSYSIHRDQTLPENWSTSICVGDNCYAPFISDGELTDLDPGASEDLWIYVNVADNPGTAHATLTVTSQGDPEQLRALTYTGIHERCDLLVVDDGGAGSPIEATLQAAMGGRVAGYWPRVDELPTLAELQMLPMTFWLTGDEAPTLNADDRALLGDYRAAGGALLVSGQDVAEDLCDPGSPNYSVEARDWFRAAFGVSYAGSGSSLDVAGQPGDLLGEGLAFTLGGGQTDPDYVDLLPGEPISVSFRYGAGPQAGEVAGVTRGGGAPTIFLAFGMEGAGDALDDLVARACLVLDTPTAAGGQAPASLALLGNYPNPFNPKTTLRFVAPGQGAARLEVFDPAGRLVFSRALSVAAGENRVDFLGADAAGVPLASGVYQVRISQDGASAGGKMTLLK